MSLKVLVHAQAAHVRLAIVDGLRGVAEVVHAGDDPIKALRASRADVVLVALRRRDRRPTLALARRIKTDGRQPPLVALIDPSGVLSDPALACERTEADGCLQGPIDAAGLSELLAGLCVAGATVVGEAPGGWGLLRR